MIFPLFFMYSITKRNINFKTKKSKNEVFMIDTDWLNKSLINTRVKEIYFYIFDFDFDLKKILFAMMFDGIENDPNNFKKK